MVLARCDPESSCVALEADVVPEGVLLPAAVVAGAEVLHQQPGSGDERLMRRTRKVAEK